MARLVTHRWNPPDDGRSPGNGMPDVGDIVAGPLNHWRVVEVLPVESKKYPNPWRARMAPLGRHGLTRQQLQGTSWWVYEPRQPVSGSES